MEKDHEMVVGEDETQAPIETPLLAEMSVVEMASYYARELREGTEDREPVGTLEGLVALLDRSEVAPAETTEEVVARLEFADDPGAEEQLLLALLREGRIEEYHLRDLISPAKCGAARPGPSAAESTAAISPRQWSTIALFGIFLVVFAAGLGLSRLVSDDFLTNDQLLPSRPASAPAE